MADYLLWFLVGSDVATLTWNNGQQANNDITSARPITILPLSVTGGIIAETVDKIIQQIYLFKQDLCLLCYKQSQNNLKTEQMGNLLAMRICNFWTLADKAIEEAKNYIDGTIKSTKHKNRDNYSDNTALTMIPSNLPIINHIGIRKCFNKLKAPALWEMQAHLRDAGYVTFDCIYPHDVAKRYLSIFYPNIDIEKQFRLFSVGSIPWANVEKYIRIPIPKNQDLVSMLGAKLTLIWLNGLKTKDKYLIGLKARKYYQELINYQENINKDNIIKTQVVQNTKNYDISQIQPKLDMMLSKLILKQEFAKTINSNLFQINDYDLNNIQKHYSIGIILPDDLCNMEGFNIEEGIFPIRRLIVGKYININGISRNTKVIDIYKGIKEIIEAQIDESIDQDNRNNNTGINKKSTIITFIFLLII